VAHKRCTNKRGPAVTPLGNDGGGTHCHPGKTVCLSSWNRKIPLTVTTRPGSKCETSGKSETKNGSNSSQKKTGSGGIRSHNLFRAENQAGNSNHQNRAMVGQKRSHGDAVLETPSPRQNVLRSGVRKGFSDQDTDEEKGQLRDAIRAVLGGHTFTDNDGEVWGWDRVFVNACVGKVRLFPAWPCASILKLACWCPGTLSPLLARQACFGHVQPSPMSHVTAGQGGQQELAGSARL